MRKFKFILLILFLFSIMAPKVNALNYLEEDDWEGYVLVGETTKYYKTVTYYDNGIYTIDGFTNAVNNARSETIEIDEEEFNSIDASSFRVLELRNTTTVETTYKEMITSLYANGSSYRYKNVLMWKVFPAVRSNDITAIGFLPSVTPTNYHFEQYYCVSGSGCSYLATGYPSLFSSGMSIIFQLPTSSNLTSLKSTFYFDVTKTNPNSTIVTQYAYGDYAHATSTIGITAAADHEVIQSIAILLGSDISSYYDNISVADVYYPCNW